MSALNQFFNKLFAMVWTPFQTISPWVGLLVLSVLVGILALIAMKYCSNQDRIVELKDRYKAHVLAIRLFRDDLKVVILSMFRTLGHIGCYMGHQLRPMAVLIVPFVFLFAQMQMRLAYEPTDLGDVVLVEVALQDGIKPGLEGDLGIDLPDGVEIAGTVVDVPARSSVKIPIRATKAGRHELKFTWAGETVTKTFHAATDDLDNLSKMRSSGALDLLLYPSEAAFPGDSHFQKIELPYGIKPLMFLGIDWSFGMELGMGIVFMVVSIVAAVALKGVFGVTI